MKEPLSDKAHKSQLKKQLIKAQYSGGTGTQPKSRQELEDPTSTNPY